MRNKKFVVFMIFFLAVFLTSSFADTKKIYRLGVHPLMVKGVISPEQLKEVVWKYDKQIKEGFELAGHGDLYLDFMNLIEPSTFEEKTLPTGTKLTWMLYKPGWKVRVAKDVEWAAKKPLEVFAVTLNRDCVNYKFVIPKKCGNISLLKAESECASCDLRVDKAKVSLNETFTIDMSSSKCAQSMEIEIIAADGTKVAGQTLSPTDPKWQTQLDNPGEYTIKGSVFNPKCDPPSTACEAKIAVKAPPVCCVKVLPDKKFVKKPIIIDATCSNDPDGEIVEAAFEVKDKEGNVVATQVMKEGPFKWETQFEKPGNYTVCLKMADNDGGTCESCETKFVVKGKPLYGLVALGPLLAKGTYSFYLFGRAGLGLWLVPDTLDLALSAGGGITLTGDPFKSFVMATLIMNYHTGAFWFGGGLGFTTDIKPDWDGGLNVVGNVGIDIFNTGNSTGSIFGELRFPVGDGHDFADHHMILLGFKYIFGF